MGKIPAWAYECPKSADTLHRWLLGEGAVSCEYCGTVLDGEDAATVGVGAATPGKEPTNDRG